MTRTRLLTTAGVVLVLLSAVPEDYAQTYTVVFNFCCPSGGKPSEPNATLVQNTAGSLYGIVIDIHSSTGVHDEDMFEITPAGTLTMLRSLGAQADNVTDGNGLTRGTDGNYYGITEYGGANLSGSIFRMTPGGALTTLHTFDGPDGLGPLAPPIQGLDGNFYGTTPEGGANSDGVVYQITPSGTYTLLHTFSGADGVGPGALVLGTDGYFYGTTCGGGGSNDGTFFRLSHFGNLVTLFSFDGTNGSCPNVPLMQASNGDFYGTTQQGGAGSPATGVIFKITRYGNLHVLHNLSNHLIPAGLVQATDGNFYGAVIGGGGSASCGEFFRLSPTGVFTKLLTLPSGCGIYNAMVQHTNGLLYGVTTSGFDGVGVLFSFDVGAAPFVSVQPSARLVGGTVDILGQGFTGTTAVSFDGTAATFQVFSDTYIKAVVPDEATSGVVSVTTPGGVLQSNKSFQVRPQIARINPTSGPAGTMVTITGDSLTQTSSVVFDGVQASFTVNSDKQVVAAVPAGAATGPLFLVTTNTPAYSPTQFTVTQ
jgi:uncharacterized repeat protein (TIGR03803 family)